MEFTKELRPKQLLAALSSACFSSVHLFWGEADGHWPPPPPLLPMVFSVLASRSASTLTALHDLPLVEPWMEPPPDDPGLGLAALTRLHTLTLRQTWDGFAELRATDLPPSLEDLALVMDRPVDVSAVWEDLPLFIAFDRLQNLRRITLTEYLSWARWDRLESRRQPTLLPPSLEVRAPSA